MSQPSWTSAGSSSAAGAPRAGRLHRRPRGFRHLARRWTAACWCRARRPSWWSTAASSWRCDGGSGGARRGHRVGRDRAGDRLGAARARVTATDISPAALDVAWANAVALGLAVELRQGDPAMRRIDRGGGRRFDLIVSNPPYVSEQEIEGLSRRSPCTSLAWRARRPGRPRCLPAAAPDAREHLGSRADGWCWSAARGRRHGGRRARRLGYGARRTSRRDLAGIERVVSGGGGRASRSGDAAERLRAARSRRAFPRTRCTASPARPGSRRRRELYELKGRAPASRRRSSAFSSMALLALLEASARAAASLARCVLPGPVTLVVENPAVASRSLRRCAGEDRRAGAAAEPGVAALADAVGGLLITSANLRGGRRPRSLEEVPRR